MRSKPTPTIATMSEFQGKTFLRTQMKLHHSLKLDDVICGQCPLMFLLLNILLGEQVVQRAKCFLRGDLGTLPPTFSREHTVVCLLLVPVVILPLVQYIWHCGRSRQDGTFTLHLFKVFQVMRFILHPIYDLGIQD